MPVDMKMVISSTFMSMARQKGIDKITVKALIEACNISRQTFYYHFQDIYSLLQWMLEQEAIDVVKNFDLVVDTEEGMTQLIAVLKSCRFISVSVIQHRYRSYLGYSSIIMVRLM